MQADPVLTWSTGFDFLPDPSEHAFTFSVEPVSGYTITVWHTLPPLPHQRLLHAPLASHLRFSGLAPECIRRSLTAYWLFRGGKLSQFGYLRESCSVLYSEAPIGSCCCYFSVVTSSCQAAPETACPPLLCHCSPPYFCH